MSEIRRKIMLVFFMCLLIVGWSTANASLAGHHDGIDNTPEGFYVTADVDGNGEQATDPDGDGLYEDVNGDGEAACEDAEALGENINSSAVQNNVSAFDFTDDGEVNFGDVESLQEEVCSQESTSTPTPDDETTPTPEEDETPTPDDETTPTPEPEQDEGNRPVPAFEYNPKSPDPGTTVQFDASQSTDSDGTIESYRWFIQGPDSQVEKTGQTITHTFSESAEYAVELTVRDSSGLSNTTFETIQVGSASDNESRGDSGGRSGESDETEGNQPPTPRFDYDPDSPAPNETVTFDASPSTDDNSTISSYRWEIYGTESQINATGQTITHTFSEAGEYGVELFITDGNGIKNSTFRTIEVGNVPRKRPEKKPENGSVPPPEKRPPDNETERPPGNETERPPERSAGQVNITNIECIANCEGVQTNQIKTETSFISVGDSIISANINLKNASGGRDLTTLGATADTRFRIDLRFKLNNGTFDPQTVVAIGSKGQLVSSTSGSTATATVEFGLTRGAVNFDVDVGEPGRWPQRNVTANLEIEAIGILNIAQLGDANEKDELSNVFIATNAQTFEPPTYESPNTGQPRLKVQIAAPHFEPDGQTINTGNFYALLPNQLISSWGVSDPDQLTATTPSGGGTLNVSSVSGGLEIRLTNYHYSSGNVTIQPTSTNESTGDSNESEQTDSLDTTVSLSPSSVRTTPTGSTTVDIVVNSATSGIGTVNMTVRANDPNTVTITDIDYKGAGSFFTRDFAADNSSLEFSGGAAGINGPGKATVATITVSGQTVGGTELTLTIDRLANTSGNAYTITDVTNTTITVANKTGPPPVAGGGSGGNNGNAGGGQSNTPTNADRDTAYEDVDGDGSFSVNDLTVFFANLNSNTIKNNKEFFDYDGDGQVSINDLTQLYNELRNN